MCACVQFALITGSALLTDRQKLWRDIMRQAGSLKAVRKLQRPPGRIRVCGSSCGMQTGCDLALTVREMCHEQEHMHPAPVLY